MDVIRQIDIALDNDVIALLVRAPWRTGCYFCEQIYEISIET